MSTVGWWNGKCEMSLCGRFWLGEGGQDHIFVSKLLQLDVQLQWRHLYSCFALCIGFGVWIVATDTIGHQDPFSYLNYIWKTETVKQFVLVWYALQVFRICVEVLYHGVKWWHDKLHCHYVTVSHRHGYCPNFSEWFSDGRGPRDGGMDVKYTKQRPSVTENIWKTIKAAMQQLHSSYSEYFVVIVLSSVTHWHALKKKKGPVFLCPGVQRF